MERTTRTDDGLRGESTLLRLRWRRPLAISAVRWVAYLGLMIGGHWLGYQLKIPGSDLTTLWVPAGIGLAILMLEPVRAMPFHVLWMFALDVSISMLWFESASGWVPAAWFAGANALGLVVAALALRRFATVPLNCARVTDYAAFAVVVSFVAPIISGALGSLGLWWWQKQPFLDEFLRWWAGDALGMHLAGPAVMAVAGLPWTRVRRRPTEFLIGVGIYGVAIALVLGRGPAPSSFIFGVAGVSLPFLIWVAVRFGWRPLAVSLLGYGCLIVVEVLLGRSPLLLGQTIDALGSTAAVQAHLMLVSVPCMLLGAFVDGLRRNERQLLEEIGAREKAEAVRRELENEMQARQRLEVVGRLASGAAHDMNNMLTVIRGNLDLIERRAGSESADSCRAMRKATEQASKLMSSLSLLGRAVQDDRQPCRLQDLVTSTEGLLTPTLPKSIHLRSRLSDDDLRVLVNTDQLQQTLVNLVLNAREAMPDGGAIEIGAETDSRDAETTVLWVEDEGHGIPLALQDLVMESFFTTKESGTGLGLAVAQRVVGDHGGRLSFTSQPGRGTRFEIRLPRMAAESSQGAARVVEAGAGEVVVSYLPVRLARTVGSYLPAANYRLREATSADELLDLVRVAQQESDDAERYLQAIILSDETDGREVLARLRGDGCRTPVLLIGKEGARDGGKLDSRTVFLAQPVDGFALLRRLNERLGPYRTHSSSLFNRQVS